MSKNKDAQAAKAILEYLTKQNRPYSAVDIFNNLHKEYGKTAVVKCLESMAADGKIKEKINGKQKVYVADQSQFAVVDDSELKAMDQKISQISQKLQESSTAAKRADAEQRQLNSALTTEEAQAQLGKLTQECSSLNQRLQQLKSNQNAVSPAERQQIMKDRTKYVKEWRKRKRMSMDILNAILEGYPKSKKELFEEIGIETDEEYNVKPPEL